MAKSLIIITSKEMGTVSWVSGVLVISGRFPALCQQYWIVDVLTSSQAC